ncbi:MAG: diversity-generating retroelement protein Avd [Gomphosphaeria aponina SAG 52.96 = DSM 107014]|uniref:Diversity-generating retroelement protein Avd n=1 Tax=Gomphosphaeria aponina SAG 52.96 = DSM 107014 TaxID=1521640 RepID=A0A941GYW6_9CHRO|nr:diversity-generating retroelement protein Avd [Gomphosphaeria aponina SAG 52.96 = DSM 107014]
MKELSIIQKTYDLIKWYVPLLNRLPRNHKFLLGDRIISGLYDLLDGLILARYSREKQPILEKLNALLDVLRYQSRLLKDFGLIKVERYEYASQLITEIGQELGGWIKQQSSRRGKTSPPPDPSSTGRGEAEQITIMAQLP